MEFKLKNSDFASGEKGRQIINVLLLLGFAILLGNSMTLIVGFVAKGFDTSTILQQFSIYQDILLGGAILIAISFFIEFLVLKGDKRYGSSIFFASPGKFPSSKFWQRFQGWQITLMFIFFMGVAGLISSSLRQTSFIGFAQLGQQFSEVSSIVFSGFLVPVAENAQWLGVLAFIVVIFRLVARRYDLSKETFKFYTGVIMIAGGGILGVANHLLRYGGSDFNLIVVGIFWAIGGYLTFTTGSFIPFWTMHFMNNLFFDLKRYFSSDTITILAIVVLVIVAGIYFALSGRYWAGDSTRVRNE